MTTLLIGKQDGNGIKSSRETCRILRLRRLLHGRIHHGKIGIHGGGFLQNMTKGSEFFRFSFGLPERSTDNSTECVHRTHTLLACITDTTVISQAPTTFVLVAQARFQRHHCAHETSLPSGQQCHRLACLYRVSSSPQHEAPPGRHDRLQDNDVHRALLYGRQAAQKNRSRTSITRVAETRAAPLPQVMSPKSLRPKSLRLFLEVLWKTSINYTMYRELGEQDHQAPIIEEVKEPGVFQFLQTQSLLDHEMAEMSLVQKMVLPPVPDALRRVYGRQFGLWSRRWRVAKVADFTTVCPKIFWETRCNGRVGEK